MLHEEFIQYYPPHRVILFAVSMLYLSGAVYIRMRYPKLHYSITLAILSVGGALFIAANSIVLFGRVAELPGRLFMSLLFTLGLLFGVWSVKVQVEALEYLRKEKTVDAPEEKL